MLEPLNEGGAERGADDLRTSILKEIGASTYTCLVCTDYITPSSKVWSCDHCHRAFDLDCIKDWALRGSSTQDDKSWRCPSCNRSHSKIPKLYTCWCGKSINPTLNVLEPHSCGNTCGSPLKTCIHECSLQCHPGPHMERCTALGPVLKCRCGRHSKQLPCVLTPYDRGWSCDEVCNDILPCGIHRCKQKCHSGLCGECEEEISVRCYCGKASETIVCHERLPIKSEENGVAWIGNFECNDPCGEFFDCGVHKCEQNCHPVNKDSHKCPNSPLNLIYCPCGKTKIDSLLDSPRKSCLDPIPTCESVCGKRLPCGHKCYWNCHDGPCSPCYRTVDAECRCGFTSFSIACALITQGYTPTCTIKCNAKFNCKRHYCTRVCCEFRQVAFDRSKLIKKHLRKNIITSAIAESVEFEDVHTCQKECNQLLSCGKHRCKATCHPGSCSPCLESSSDDLVCNCGRTVVPAPVRCGTTLPICPFQCARQTTCGHRPEPHHCHEDDVSCPKCTMLVTKRCQCEKQNLVTNVMCYQDRVSCFRLCGKKLPCGEHECKKVCHKPGDCQKKCTEKCLKTRKCGHKCQQTCHFGKLCNEALPCQEHVTVTCNCGRRKQPLLCYTVANMIKESKSSHNAEVNGSSIDDESFTPHIACDEMCEKERRNRLLFDALGLNPARAKDTEVMLRMRTVESIYTPFTLNIYAKQAAWCKGIEEIFSQLLAHTMESSFRSLSNSEIKQSHHFRPMREVQRRFVHELAESWGLFSEAHDPEPHRSVFVKLVKSSKIPDIKLQEAHEIYQKYKALEKKKSLERVSRQEEKEKHASDSPEHIYFNGIIIKDVFFGVTVETIDASFFNIWNQTENESRKFPLVKNGRVEFICENMYVFYGDSCLEEEKPALEKQIEKLRPLFDKRVKDSNLALKCILAKVNIEEGTVVEMMDESNHRDEEATGKAQIHDNLVDVATETIDDVKVEAVTVPSEWW